MAQLNGGSGSDGSELDGADTAMLDEDDTTIDPNRKLRDDARSDPMEDQTETEPAPSNVSTGGSSDPMASPGGDGPGTSTSTTAETSGRQTGPGPGDDGPRISSGQADPGSANNTGTQTTGPGPSDDGPRTSSGSPGDRGTKFVPPAASGRNPNPPAESPSGSGSGPASGGDVADVPASSSAVTQAESYFQRELGGRDVQYGEDFVLVESGGGYQAVLTESFLQEYAGELFEEQIESQTGRDVTAGEEFTVRVGDGEIFADLSAEFVAELSRDAAREAGIDLSAGGAAPTGIALESGDVLAGLADVNRPESRGQPNSIDVEAALDFSQRRDAADRANRINAARASGAMSASTTAINQARQNIIAGLEAQIAAQTGTTVDLGPEDVLFSQQGNNIFGELSSEGRETVAVETADLVQATRGTAFEPIARRGAEASFAYSEVRAGNRQLFQSSLAGASSDVQDALLGLQFRANPDDEFTTIGDVVGDIDEGLAAQYGSLGPILFREQLDDDLRPVDDLAAGVLDDGSDFSEQYESLGPVRVRASAQDTPVAIENLLSDEADKILSAATTQYGSLGPVGVRASVEDEPRAIEDVAADTANLIGQIEPGETTSEDLFKAAAATAPVAVGEPTFVGEAAVVGITVAGAGVLAAETLNELPDDQRLALGTAASIASNPVGAARDALSTEVPAGLVASADAEGELEETRWGEMVIDRGELVIDPDTGEAEVVLPDLEKGRIFFPPEEGALPPEQAPPELTLPLDEAMRREQVGDELIFPRDPSIPVQEDPINLPEVLVPTDPKTQFTSGRFTPPEVSINEGAATDTFGGPEVPLDDSFEGQEQAEDFLFPGPEVPGVDESFEDFPQPDTTLEAQRQQTILRKPEPTIIEDPADVARKSGPAGPAFIKPRSPRVSDPYIIETPRTNLDLPLLDPELARVLRNKELQETATGPVLDVAQEPILGGEPIGSGQGSLSLLAEQVTGDDLAGSNLAQLERLGLAEILGVGSRQRTGQLLSDDVAQDTRSTLVQGLGFGSDLTADVDVTTPNITEGFGYPTDYGFGDDVVTDYPVTYPNLFGTSSRKKLRPPGPDEGDDEDPAPEFGGSSTLIERELLNPFTGR